MAETGHIELFDAIHTARALRRLKPDPVPDEVITKILDAAVRAPTGSNAQDWLFVVVKDPQRKKKLGDVYRKGAGIITALYANRERPAHVSEQQYEKMLASATYLFEHMAEAPLLLLACLKLAPPPMPTNIPPDFANAARVMARLSGASIYPAVQNIILACRAYGLGTVLTTIHAFFEDEVKAALGLPTDVLTYALLPIGYPINKFGPIRRRPLREVAFLDRYGNNWPA